MNKMHLAVLFVLLQSAPALAQPQCFWGWGHMGGWGFMMFFWLIILAVLVYGIFSFSRNRGGGAQTGGKALDILKERYARGEISREEFERMKKDIE